MSKLTALQSISNLDLPLVLFPNNPDAVQQFSDKLANKITTDFLVEHGKSLLSAQEEHQLSLLTTAESKTNLIFEFIKAKNPLLEAIFINQVLETKAQIVSSILGLSDNDKFPSSESELISQLQAKTKDLSPNQIFALIS